MKTRLTGISFVLVFFMLIDQANGQVPGTLSYQGILMQNDGITPLTDGTHSIVFNFYSAPTGGSALQTRTISVTTVKGLYTCIIGDGASGNAALPSSLGTQQIYIGITVDGGSELSPRAQLTPAAYAFQAQSAYAISDDAVTTAKILDGTIVNSDINSGAAIAGTKVTPTFGSQNISTTGTINSGAITATSFSGDGSPITNLTIANLNGLIPTSKLATVASANTASALVTRDVSGNFSAGVITANLNGNASTVTTNAPLSGDVTSTGNVTSIANLPDSKLATISTAGKVLNSATTASSTNTANAVVARDASGNFSAGTITASLNGNASTVTTNANLTGDVTSTGNATSIAPGVIVNADVSGSAGIVDTKLGTIFTAGKVLNSATTATSTNTNSAIVARDASGSFSASVITGSNYQFSSEKTCYYSVAPEEFYGGSVLWVLDGSPYYGHLEMGGANSNIFAPLHLPQGATIGEVRLYYVDNSSADLTVSLRRRSIDGLMSETFGPVSTTENDAIPHEVFFNPSITVTVENENFRYGIVLDTSGSAVWVYNVRITYTMSQVGN